MLQRHFIFVNFSELKTFGAFNMYHSKPHNKIWILSDFICYFSCIYWFILCQITLKMESIYKWTQKRLKLGMVSSFDPYNMCAKVERITAKLDALRVQTGPSLSKVQGFHTKTHLLQRHFIVQNLFRLKIFFAFNMHHSKPHTKISTLSDFVCYFSCI